MKYILKDELKESDWNAFIERHPHGNIFQTPEMFEVYSKTKNYTPFVTALYKNDELIGVLVALIQKESLVSGKTGI